MTVNTLEEGYEYLISRAKAKGLSGAWTVEAWCVVEGDQMLHLAVVRDDDGTLAYYLDGKKQEANLE